MQGASNTGSPFKWTAQPRGNDPGKPLNGSASPDHQQLPLAHALPSGYYSPLRANLANVSSPTARRRVIEGRKMHILGLGTGLETPG